jgi:hypothetical protein
MYIKRHNLQSLLILPTSFFLIKEANGSKGPIPMAVLCEAYVYGRSIVGIIGSNFAEDMGCPSVVSCMCCVGSGVCHQLITRSEESYWVCVQLFMI